MLYLMKRVTTVTEWFAAVAPTGLEAYGRVENGMAARLSREQGVTLTNETAVPFDGDEVVVFRDRAGLSEGLDALARGDVHSLDAVEAELLPEKEV